MVKNPALSIQTPKIDRFLPKTIDFDDLRNIDEFKDRSLLRVASSAND